MKIKIFSISILLLGSVFFSSFLNNTNTKKVKADEVLPVSKILHYDDETYDTPVYLYLCELNLEQERFYGVKEWKSSKKVGEDLVYTTHKTVFKIESQSDLDEFLSEMDYYNFLIDEEAYNYADDPEDALGNHFVLISYEDYIISPGSYIMATNIYEIYDFSHEILDVINPNTVRLDKSLFYLEDIQSPVLSATNNMLITNYENPIALSQIKELITAYDNQDGDITDKIVVSEDNYTNRNKKELGTYTITFEVTDNSLNTSSLTISVKVEDITDPYLAVPEVITSFTNNPFNLSTIRALCTLEDNFDSRDSLKSGFKVISEKYSGNENVPGRYEVVLALSDSSGNTTYRSTYINVVDKTKPTISGVNSYTKTITANLKISNIMSGLTASDDVDGNISDRITLVSDNYSENSKRAGTYEVVFNVKDSAGNVSNNFTVQVVVSDDVLPVFYVDSSIINVTEYEAMSHQDIVDFLIDTQAINKNAKRISFVSDDYTANSSTPGTYKVSLKVDYEDNETEIINLDINVLEDDTGNELIEKEPTNWFLRIINFIKNIFAKLINLFVKMFELAKRMF